MVTIFPYYPVIGDKFNKWLLHNKWNHSDWATFLAGVLGFCGAFVALYGIRWQVFRNEKRKEKDEKMHLLLTLKYCLEINIENIKNFDYVFLILDFLSYNISNHIFFKKDIFYEFEKNYFTITNKIFQFSFYKEVLILNQQIKYLNEAYKKLGDHLPEKKRIMDKLLKAKGTQPPFFRIREYIEELRIKNTVYSFDGKKLPLEKRKNIVQNTLKKIRPLIENGSFLSLIYNDVIDEKEKQLLSDLHEYEKYIIINDLFAVKEDIENLLKKVNLCINELK